MPWNEIAASKDKQHHRETKLNGYNSQAGSRYLSPEQRAVTSEYKSTLLHQPGRGQHMNLR
jgi:hypothetical protein